MSDEFGQFFCDLEESQRLENSNLAKDGRIGGRGMTGRRRHIYDQLRVTYLNEFGGADSVSLEARGSAYL